MFYELLGCSHDYHGQLKRRNILSANCSKIVNLITLCSRVNIDGELETVSGPCDQQIVDVDSPVLSRFDLTPSEFHVGCCSKSITFDSESLNEDVNMHVSFVDSHVTIDSSSMITTSFGKLFFPVCFLLLISKFLFFLF